MEFECHMCNQKIREEALNTHLRSHSLDVYNDVLFWSIHSNIIKLCEHILIAAFNSKYEEIKHILDAKNLSNLILPSLEIEQMNDGILLNIMTDDLFDYDVVKFVNITEIKVIPMMRDKCSREKNDQTFIEDCTLYLHCQSCRNPQNKNLKMPETHVYNHLRRHHQLIGGGKDKAAPTQPAYELFSLELNPFNIRELLARAVRLEFYKYCSSWKHLGIHFSLSFERLHVTSHNTHSLLMKIQDVKQLDTFRVESIPYLMNHLWQTFFQQEQWEFDYLGLSIGEIPLKPKRKIGSLNSIEINGNKYKLIRKIGKGGFGLCFKMLNIATDRKFACKEVQMEFIYLEAEIHSTLNHPNIVSFIEGQQLEGHMYMVLELCNHSVQDLQRNNLHIGKNVIDSITKGVTKALVYIHGLSIMHRDIKPSNLLLTANGEVKVCDFGLAARYDANDLYYKRCGTMYYLAPEVVAHRGWTPKADMWALGATIYMLLAGKRLFEGKTKAEVYKNISAFQKITFPDHWDHNSKILISDLLEVNIEIRSAAEDFLMTLNVFSH